MPVSVKCPSCHASSAVPPEALGRTGRCNKCGARIRLATPVAERLDAPPPAAPADDPVPMAEAVPEALPIPQAVLQPVPLSAKPAPRPVAEEQWPESPVVL